MVNNFFLAGWLVGWLVVVMVMVVPCLKFPPVFPKELNPQIPGRFDVSNPPSAWYTGMSMVLRKWIITPIYVGCKSCK